MHTSHSPGPRRHRFTSTAAAVLLLTLAGCGGNTTDSTAPTESSIAASTPATTSASSAPSPEPAPTSAPTVAPPSSSVPPSPETSSTPPSSSEPTTAAPSPSSEASPEPTAEPTLVLPASRPVRLEVPAIGVDTDLLELGQNADGTIEVPDVDDPNSPAGWYTGSPSPGELGPSILLGHVDSRKLGPGVFFDLADVPVGAEVRVSRADGSVAVFEVDKVESYQKLEFPTLTVYGNLDHAGLRLITCGGAFDADAGSYESNIIAFARLVSTSEATSK